MQISWVIENYGAGTTSVADVDQAAGALDDALRAAYVDADPTTLAHVLWDVLGPIRFVLVTEGRAAVGRGETWSIQRAGLLVSLAP
jgi:hypothetical protein